MTPTPSCPTQEQTRAAPSGPALERVTVALRELRELTEERATRVSEIETQRERRTAEAERAFEADTTGARSEYDSTLEAAKAEERHRHGEIAAEYDDVLKSLYRERDGLLAVADEESAERLERHELTIRESRDLVTIVRDSDNDQTNAKARSRLESLDAIKRDAREAAQARRDLAQDLGFTPADPPAADIDGPHESVEALAGDAQQSIYDARAALDRLSRSPFPRLARGATYWAFATILLLLGAGVGFFLAGFAIGGPLYAGAGGAVVLAAGARFLFGAVARTKIARHDAAAAASIARADALEEAARARTKAEQRERLDEIEAAAKEERASIDEKAISKRDRLHTESRKKSEEIHAAYTPKIERYEQERDAKRQEATRRRTSIEEQARARFEELTAGARETRERAIAQANDDADRERTELDVRWREAEPRLREECEKLHRAGERHAPTWDQTHANPDPVPPPLCRLGRARWDVPETAADVPVEWHGPATIQLPIPVEFPRIGSVLYEHTAADRARTIEYMRAAMLRLLTTLPPGKVRFTIIDPVGLGESFAAFMHLADHQEQLVSGRIWTEPRHIEQRLLDLTEHMESVIQKYLRNDYPSIEAYNRAAGEIAEPYRYLVVADFPTNISDAAGKRIASIASSGARCGVHTLIAHDPSKPPPKGVSVDDLRAASLTIRVDGDAIGLPGREPLACARLEHDTTPDDVRTRELLREVGTLSIDAGRVQVPFSAVGPGEGERWSASAAGVLRIPIGRSGASKIQELVLGEGTAQHALIAGRTGSGKSTLFHVMITSAAAWYSTDEVELYLVDFKKGVEFKPYATHALPHARVIAIETDRAFGLSVLQRIDQELTDRGERMRTAEVQNLAAFREKTGEAMPRVLLIVDEFQELFVEDDQIAQQSAMLLDRIVRQGRAFGVHVVLGSQTLGGAYAINRATMSQMNVRIALQCDEQDSYLILGEDNSAARLLERPGEAVYNAQGGKVEANSPFQVVWLPDTVRDETLERIASDAKRSGARPPAPVVFEGNAPADPKRTPELVTPRDAPAPASEPVPAHLGVPVAIAPPVRARLERSRAENLLVLSTNADAARAMLATTLLGFDRFVRATAGAVAHVVHAERDEARHSVGAFAAGLPLDARVADARGVEATLLELDAELDRRGLVDASGEPPILFLLAGLHLCRDIKRPDDMGFSSFGDDEPAKTPGALLDRIVQEGPELGVHAVVWADTLDAFERAFDRRRLGEFSHRVLTQMNAMDSAAVLDSPAASRLAQGRALYYNDRTTQSVTLRPYAFPDAD